MLFNHGLPRKSFWADEKIPYLTFNSIKNQNRIGDERYNFVTVKKWGDPVFKKLISVDLGDKFTLRIFYHNDTDVSVGSKGVSKDTKVCFTWGAFCSFEDEWDSIGPECNGFMGYVKYPDPDRPGTPGARAHVQDFCVVKILNEDRAPYSIFARPIEGSARVINQLGSHSVDEKDLGGTEFDDYGLLVGDQLDGIVPAGSFGYVELDFETYKVEQ